MTMWLSPTSGLPRRDVRRRDAAVLRAVKDHWEPAERIAHRLGLSTAAGAQALYRARQRGLPIEGKSHRGWRRVPDESVL